MHFAPLTWETTSAAISLAENEVHIWRTSLVKTFQEKTRLQTFLAADEIVRARSFLSQEQQERWIVARGTLRFLLGAYLGICPSRLSFLYNQYGKPTIGGEERAAGLHFNLSHSADCAFYAFTYRRRLGLDVEHLRSNLAGLRLARKKFALGEYEALQALPPREQARAFFTCWTRKEAYIKARGEGIAYGLKSFEVSLKPSEPAALLVNRQNALECERWSMHDLVAGPDYVGALVVERSAQALTYCSHEFAHLAAFCDTTD